MKKGTILAGVAEAIKNGKIVIWCERSSKTFYEDGDLKRVVLPRINDKAAKLYQLEDIRKRCFYPSYELSRSETPINPAEVYVDIAIVEDYHFKFGRFEHAKKLNWFSGDLDNKFEVEMKLVLGDERDYYFTKTAETETEK